VQHGLRGTRDGVGIQSLRGIAVVLMVAGHVIGSDAARGLRVDDDSLWRLFYVGLEDLRMPLFTTISGFVYALRPVRDRTRYPDLVRGKVRRLLVPLLTVGAVLFLVELLVPGVNRRPEPGDAWRIYVYPFEHLWFLQAIFLIFLAVGLMDATGRLARIGTWSVALAAACALYVLLVVPAHANLFSTNGALRLLPFFLLGVGLHRFGQVLDRRLLLIWWLPGFAVVYCLRVASVLGEAQVAAPLARALGLAVGLTGMASIFLLRAAVQARVLTWIGGFSFGIYLLHVFPAAAARLALQALGMDSDIALFGLCLATGLVVPILFELTVGRVPMVGRLVLGSRPKVTPQRVPGSDRDSTCALHSIARPEHAGQGGPGL
jgi:fucose 4-O-acetylase-like acetyltransferase